MSFGFNAQVTQGNLNRIITHIAVANLPQLNVPAGFMAKGMAVQTFDDDYTKQIPTATGIVNSPEPFVMSTIVINLLRPQPLANAWFVQAQLLTQIGNVTAYPDVTAPGLAPITIVNTSILRVDPGAYDGQDPTTKVTIRGQVYINAALWGSSGLTGQVTLSV